MRSSRTRFVALLRASCSVVALTAAWPDVPAQQDPFQELKGPQIQSVLKGKYVTDERHWGHHYLADGRVTRLEGGRQKSGRWSVQHDQLCLLKPEVSTKEPVCYSVHRRANEVQYLAGGQVVYRGLVLTRGDAHMFQGVVDR